jgi:hypothetical protein
LNRLLIFIIVACWASEPAPAQTLGGRAGYSFLKLSPSPQLSALGGVAAAPQTSDVNMAYYQPALLTPAMHQHLGASINLLYGGVKNMFVTYSRHAPKLNTSFAASVQFTNYGNTPQTDDAGNTTGSFNPADFVVQLTAARQYQQRWRYGASLKFISSNYGPYRSLAVAIDAGVTYTDTAHLLQAGLLIKHAGAALTAYTGSRKDDLPLDIQIGISKKLAKAPVQFSATLHHLHQFDIRYADTLFEAEVSGDVKKGRFTADKLFRHFVLAAQIYPSKQTELTLAYNVLRRKELSLFNIGSGLTGFSFGGGVLFKTLQVRYARAYYQNTRAYNQLGLTVNLTSP